MERGWFTIFRSRGGYALRVHASYLFVLFIMGEFSFSPMIWLGVTLVLAAHELGHIGAIKHFRGIVTSTELFLFRGNTNYLGADRGGHRLWVASGGVIGQAVLLALVYLTSFAAPDFIERVPPGLLHALIQVNFFFLAIELIPYPPLDGAQIWPLLFPKGGRPSKPSQSMPMAANGGKRRSDSQRKFVVVKGGKGIPNRNDDDS